MTLLYHFSEEPGIREFVPRAPEAHPEMEPLVWAVNAEHAWTYCFPRDCPRILLWPTAGTTSEDRQRWLGRASHGRIACIEWGWLERMQTTCVYRYALSGEGFEPLAAEDTPWMFVGREAVQPDRVEPVGNLVEALAVAGVELRLMPLLAPLRDAWSSTMHVSGIRLRNAKGWPEG